MLYAEEEKHETERIKEVFVEHLRQSPNLELLWSDKVGYVWLAIGVNPVYVDTGIRIELAVDLCYRCLDDIATDVLYMTGSDHALEAADSLELTEVKRRWESYINQLPDYTYLCKNLLNGKMQSIKRGIRSHTALLAPLLWVLCEFDQKAFGNLSLARPQNQSLFHAEQGLHRLILENLEK